MFQGSRGQRGHGFGSFLSGLFRSAVPMLKPIEKQALTAEAYIARDMLGKKCLTSRLERVFDKV